jgi:hypothetical protein
MPSEVDLCNQALGHLGEAPIVGLSDDNTRARACSRLYADTRDAVLRAHRWNFAQSRATLTAGTAPAFGWSYSFPLPQDCLRVLEINDTEDGDNNEVWIVEGRNVLMHSAECRLVYVKRVTDTAQFDALFVDALTIMLAVKLSEVIRGATSKTEQLLTQYERITAPLARRVDANEGRRRKGMKPMNSLAIQARLGRMMIRSR